MQEWNQKGFWTLAEKVMHQKISEYLELSPPLTITKITKIFLTGLYILN